MARKRSPSETQPLHGNRALRWGFCHPAQGYRGNTPQTGIWFVDPLGRHCLRWDGTAKTRCHVILKQGEGYVRVKDEDKRYASEVHEGNPFKL